MPEIATSTRLDNDSERLARRRQVNKIHAKKYYEKNREIILAKKKEYWKRLKASEIQKNPINHEDNIQLDYEEEEQPMIHHEEEPIIHVEPIQPTSNQLSYDVVKQKLTNLDISNATKKKYIDDSKTLMRLSNCDNLLECLKDHKKIIKLIENGKQIQKGLFQTIVYLIDNLKISLNTVTIKIYKDIFEQYKIRSSDLTDERIISSNNAVIGYKDYMNKIKNKFGVDSKEYLLAKLYNELTVRDNYQNLIIKQNATNLSNDNNYIIVNKNKSKIILNNYKTQKKYKQIIHEVSVELDKLIKNFINNKNLDYGETLFGKSALSKIIGIMNHNVDVEGSINTLRHMKISEELNNITDPKKRQELSKKMLHSPITQRNYMRQLID
jgi:hypothetical protein